MEIDHIVQPAAAILNGKQSQPMHDADPDLSTPPMSGESKKVGADQVEHQLRLVLIGPPGSGKSVPRILGKNFHL